MLLGFVWARSGSQRFREMHSAPPFRAVIVSLLSVVHGFSLVNLVQARLSAAGFVWGRYGGLSLMEHNLFVGRCIVHHLIDLGQTSQTHETRLSVALVKA